MTSIRTHYDNLKVARDAPIEVIKAAYKSLAQRYHPDRNPGDKDAERIMQLINASYDVLSDPERRAQHDRWIAQEEARHKSIIPHPDTISPFAKHTSQSSQSRSTPPYSNPQMAAAHFLRFRPIYSFLIVGYVLWSMFSSILSPISQQPTRYSTGDHRPQNGYVFQSPLTTYFNQPDNRRNLQGIQADIMQARQYGMNDDVIYLQLIHSKKWKSAFDQWQKRGLPDETIVRQLALNLSSAPQSLRQDATEIKENFFDQHHSNPSVDIAMALLNSPWLKNDLEHPGAMQNPNNKGNRVTLLMQILSEDGRTPMAASDKIAHYRSQGANDTEIYKSLVAHSPYSHKIDAAHQQGFSDNEIAPFFGLRLKSEQN